MVKLISNLYEKLHILQNIYIKNNFFKKKESYSMDKEDLVVQEYFKNRTYGFYVDVGCYHPLQRNNTMLLYLKGWRGINIDISDFSIKLFKFLRPEDLNLNLAISNLEGEIDMFFQKKLSQLSTIKEKHAKIAFQGTIHNKKILSRRLNSILEESKYRGKRINFLNIDVEGSDFEVLQSLDFNKYSPELICIEVIEKELEKSDVFNFLYNKKYKKTWSGVFSHIFQLTN
jgi:FkbM family methyltransferase